MMLKTIILIVAIFINDVILWMMAFSLGIKTEQQARLRRLSALRKLLNGKV